MKSAKQSLFDQLQNKTATLGVVGLGYVGLPLAVAFAEAGFHVIGVDVDADKVKCLNLGNSYVEDIPSTQLQPLVNSGLLHASTDYAVLADVDTISICVPTPLRKTKDPDISYIMHAAEHISRHDVRGKLVVLESTTYPGTTEEIILPYFVEQGLTVGEDFFLAFSPERIDPGRTDYTIHTTPKVIGGTTPDCLEVALAVYGTIINLLVPVSSTSAAEMVKLLENTFRAVNIGLVNELALMCDRLDLNVWEVVDAAATKPYGFMPFFPGPGLGGHCIPIDPLYLSWKLRTLNYTARFIELADEINKHMPHHVVQKVADALNDEAKALRGSRIMIVGVAYKPNVSDTRESPALDIIQLLQDKGADVVYHDPYVPDLTHEPVDAQLVPLSVNELQMADCVILTTNHAVLDTRMISQTARLVVDTRNAMPAGAARLVSI